MSAFRDPAQGKRPWDRMLINAVDLDLDQCLVTPNPFLWLMHYAVGGFCCYYCKFD